MTAAFAGPATGIGSMPGTDVREATAVVTGELGWPHLPELPHRGPGADPVGRAGAVLVDVPLETTVDGWRFAQRPGRDLRRARSLLAEDLDAVEEALGGYSGPLKAQLTGPLTLAGSVENRAGHRAAGDPGALRDLAASLAEGATAHLADLARRLPGAVVSLQLDEPLLPVLLAGALPTPSGFGRISALDAATATGLLEAVVDAAGRLDVPVVVHCCAADVPLPLLAGLNLAGVSLDPAGAVTGGDDALAGWLDSGRLLLAGVVPAAVPVPEAGAVADGARALAGRLGFADANGLGRVVVTPTCGLAGLDQAAARSVVATVRAAGELLRDGSGGEGSGR